MDSFNLEIPLPIPESKPKYHTRMLELEVRTVLLSFESNGLAFERSI
jgi:hypothetical protein